MQLRRKYTQTLLRRFPGHIRQKYHKLITAQTTDDVLSPAMLLHDQDNLAESSVSPHMSHDIIERFEIIQIHNSKSIYTSRMKFLHKHPVDSRCARCPVHGTCQKIRPCLLLKLEHIILHIRNILDTADHTGHFSRFIVQIRSLDLQIPHTTSCPYFRLL